MLIWRGGLRESLNIRVVLNSQAAGWFVLERLKPDGSTEVVGVRLDGDEVDEDANFELSEALLASWGWGSLVFRLKIWGARPDDQDFSAFLLVDQPSGKLRPQNGLGQKQTIHANGVQLTPDLKFNKPGRFPFQVYFW